jgi:histidinol-phosphate aminotransferase
MPENMMQLVRDLYTPGETKKGYSFAESPSETAKRFAQPIARLASNENPFGPSPAVLEAIEELLPNVHRYPDDEVKKFQKALKNLHGPYAFVVGVGMDGVIETILRALVEPEDKVVMVEPTFSFYRLAAQAYHGSICPVPLNADFSVDADAVISASRGAKITFLCTPNNPTGTSVAVETITNIIKSIDGLLFLDNAYGEFCDDSLFYLMEHHTNLIIGRTMSKMYGLAGLRVGYAAVPEWFFPCYTLAETPFAVNNLSATAAAASLLDQDAAHAVLLHTIKWRERITKESPLPVVPSSANFCMIDVTPHTGTEAAQFFAERGVLIRSCDSFSGLDPHYIRVNIGLDWECEKFLKVLFEFSSITGKN